MENNLIKSESRYSFHLDGDSEIDAVLLCKSINDMVELTKLAAQINDPETYLKVNVTAFKNGSFQIDFSAICETVETLVQFLPVAASMAPSVVETVKGFFEIKKFLKGHSARSVKDVQADKIEIENQDGRVLVAPKSSGAIMNNVTIDNLTQNISIYVKEHNPEGGFSISTESGSMRCTKKDVENIMKPIPIEEETVCKRYRTEANLAIKKADFIGWSAWEFRLDDRTIKASMEDDDFLEKVHSGQIPIKAGDWIRATLEIYVDLDLLGNPIEDSCRYRLVKVLGDIHTDKGTQVEL